MHRVAGWSRSGPEAQHVVDLLRVHTTYLTRQCESRKGSFRLSEMTRRRRGSENEWVGRREEDDEDEFGAPTGVPGQRPERQMIEEESCRPGGVPNITGLWHRLSSTCLSRAH